MPTVTITALNDAKAFNDAGEVIASGSVVSVTRNTTQAQVAASIVRDALATFFQAEKQAIADAKDAVIANKQATIDALRLTVDEKNATIDAKNALIATLRARTREGRLEAAQAALAAADAAALAAAQTLADVTAEPS